MTVAQRFTTEFVDYEDRLRISTELPGGEVAVLWVTRRLLDRLVSHLAGLLERETAQAPDPKVQQAFAQQAAVATHQQQSKEQQQPPVVPQQAQIVHEWLVREVDITPAPKGVNLRFRGAQDSQKVELGMPAMLLRQWLGIVHVQYQRAGWAVDVWPAWMTEEVKVKEVAGKVGVILH